MASSDRMSEGDARSLDELLEALAAGRESGGELRESILQRATPLLDQLLDEAFTATGFPRDELYRAGYLGLINAVHNFGLAHGQPFRQYAENLIKGEIREHIRERAGRLRVPGWMADLNRQIEAAEAKLLKETGELPTLRQLASEVNITEEGIAEIFKAREALSYVSLDASQRKKDPDPAIDLSKIRSLRPTRFPIEARIRIASALERLADLQQMLCRSLFQGKED